MFIFKRKDHPFDAAHIRTAWDGTRSHSVMYMLRRLPVENRTPQGLEEHWDLYEVNEGCSKVDMATDSQTKRWVTVHRNTKPVMADNFPVLEDGNEA